MKFPIWPLVLAFLFRPDANLEGQIHDSISSVLIKVNLQEDPPAIILSWENPFQANSYTLSRRDGHRGPFQFLSTLNGSDTVYVDENIEIGRIYEYRIDRMAQAGFGSGFVSCGIKVPFKEHMGNILILIPEILEASVQDELSQYVLTLEQDGWSVSVLPTNDNDDVATIRQKIRDLNNATPGGLSSVFLLGNIPVPYSGLIAPDGHVPDHLGAWPADGIYGDLSGFYTDFVVDNSQANRPENRNIPGDGKFDQNQFAGQVTLAIGRADFSRLPAFQVSEAELTKKYLRKNIAFRRGEIPTQYRGIIQNNFSGFSEGFGQSGLKNFVHLLGEGQVRYDNYRNTLTTEPYLWSYGCGPGSYTSAGGIINTSQLAQDSLQTIFTMLFGSYFGDWDITNNLLRAALASGTVLTNAWSGRPVWVFHPMGIGETIGFCTQLSQNKSGMDYGGTFQRFVHTALMGDPTLTMYPVKSVEELSATEMDSCVLLSWFYPEDAIKDFHIFRRESGESKFQRITTEAISSNQYCDPCLEASKTYEYMIRELVLQESPTSSFYQLGHGKRAMIQTTIDPMPKAAFETIPDHFEVMFINQSEKSNSFLWDFGDGNQSTEHSPIHVYDSAGLYTVTLIASNACGADTIQQSVEIISTSVTHLPKHSPWTIYPTPFDNFVFISNSHPERIQNIIIENLQGRVIYFEEIDQPIQFQKILLPPDLPPGPYLLRLLGNDGIFTHKLVKQ